MDITKLEKTVREAARDGSLHSSLAAEGNVEAGLNVSPEFDKAAKTLAARRRVRKHSITTLLSVTTAQWA